ncbi:MAG: TIGR01777 family oxidoreductase [Polyangiaceae bacterium]
MRIVVAGGTGFIGRPLVAALVARGDEVCVVTRDPGRARSELPSAAILEAWSAHEAWSARVQAADAVVQLAGEGVADARWTPERLARIRSSRVDTTEALAAEIARAQKKPVFVSGSAVGIYGTRKDDEVVDEQGPAGDDVLAQVCTAWEAAVGPARRAGARVAIMRTGIVLGRGGGALAKMLPAFKAFAGGPLGDGGQWLSWIHIEDAVRGILFAIDSADFDGAFNLTAPKPVTMNDFARAIGGAVHRPCMMRVPGLALKIALGDGLAETLLTGQRAVPARLERAGFLFRFEELGAALADLVSR